MQLIVPKVQANTQDSNTLMHIVYYYVQLRVVIAITLLYANRCSLFQPINAFTSSLVYVCKCLHILIVTMATIGMCANLYIA